MKTVRPDAQTFAQPPQQKTNLRVLRPAVEMRFVQDDEDFLLRADP